MHVCEEMSDTADVKMLIDQGDVVGLLKAKYFAIKEAISDAEERHTKAVAGLNEPKAKAAIALHEAELLKARIEKTKESIRVKKEALSEVKEDLGEANEEIQENKVRFNFCLLIINFEGSGKISINGLKNKLESLFTELNG